jgi:hypothetical protein
MQRFDKAAVVGTLRAARPACGELERLAARAPLPPCDPTSPSTTTSRGDADCLNAWGLATLRASKNDAPMKPQSAAALKAAFDACAGAHAEPARVRIHRAISWIRRAEAEAEDPDLRFLLLWVAFNAAYARELGPMDSQREQLRIFLEKIVGLDGQQRLQEALFRQFTGPVRTLVDNRFVFEPFWRAQRAPDDAPDWEERFAAGKRRAMKALMEGETAVLLSIVCDRLYVLRNQLVHGGATWSSQVNRAQVRDGANLMGTLVPLLVALMIEHPEVDFGPIAYPVVS